MHVDYSSYLEDLLRVHVLPEPPHHGLVKEQVTLLYIYFIIRSTRKVSWVILTSHVFFLVPFVVLYHFLFLPIDVGLVLVTTGVESEVEVREAFQDEAAEGFHF
jgi:hypothetical protein